MLQIIPLQWQREVNKLQRGEQVAERGEQVGERGEQQDADEGMQKKGYSRFEYSEKDLLDAIEAVRSKVLSLNKAAQTYKIPKSTLSNKINGKTIEGRRMGPAPVLNKEEEIKLKEWILSKAKVGFPMHSDDVKDTVQHILQETKRPNPFTDSRPGDKWMKLFLNRHPEVTNRNAEYISKGKASLTEDKIRKWFQELEAYIHSVGAFRFAS